MISLKKACLLATVSMMLVPATAMAAEPAHDVVKDERGNVVMNTFANCVVTKWEATSDECGLASLGINKEQRTVYFDFNKSTLNAGEKAKLDQLTRVIASAKKVESVDVVGFADRIGTDGYNKALSMRRAQTVKSYLAGKGLKTRNIRVDALGSSMPVTHCTMQDRKELIACLAADRRVEIELNVMK